MMGEHYNAEIRALHDITRECGANKFFTNLYLNAESDIREFLRPEAGEEDTVLI